MWWAHELAALWLCLKGARIKVGKKGNWEESSCRYVKREIFCEAGTVPRMHTAVTGWVLSNWRRRRNTHGHCYDIAYIKTLSSRFAIFCAYKWKLLKYIMVTFLTRLFWLIKNPERSKSFYVLNFLLVCLHLLLTWTLADLGWTHNPSALWRAFWCWYSLSANPTLSSP